MKKRVIIPFFLLIFTLNGCKLIKHTIMLGKGEIKKSGFIEEIKYETNFGLPVVKIRINDSGQWYQFLFDTGATTTIISEELSDKLGLTVVNSFKSTDSQGNTRDHDYVVIDSLIIGNISFYNFIAGEIRYPENSILRCALKDGIIGANIMKDLIWQIDYKNEYIRFTDDLKLMEGIDDAHQIRMGRKPPSCTPYISLGKNEEKVRGVIFDTGSNGGISIPVRKKGEDEKVVKLINGSTQGLLGGGVDTNLISKDCQVQIGDLTINDVPITYNYKGKKNIGNDFFKNFIVTTDFQKRDIYLKHEGEYQFDTLDFSGHGFISSIKNGHVIITSIYETSPADLAGLKIGDTLTYMNNQPIQSYYDDLCEFYAWRRELFKSRKSLYIKVNKREEPIYIQSKEYMIY